jgi:hypothetical protein
VLAQTSFPDHLQVQQAQRTARTSNNKIQPSENRSTNSVGSVAVAFVRNRLPAIQ